MTRHCTKEITDIWQELHGGMLPNRFERKWLDQLCMDYTAELVEFAFEVSVRLNLSRIDDLKLIVQYCHKHGNERVDQAVKSAAKMGWFSLKSIEGLLVGTLSENAREKAVSGQKQGQLKPLQTEVELRVKQLRIDWQIQSGKIQEAKKELGAMVQESAKSKEQIKAEFEATESGPFKLGISFEQYLIKLDLPGRISRIEQKQDEIKKLELGLLDIENEGKKLSRSGEK